MGAGACASPQIAASSGEERRGEDGDRGEEREERREERGECAMR